MRFDREQYRRWSSTDLGHDFADGDLGRDNMQVSSLYKDIFDFVIIGLYARGRHGRTINQLSRVTQLVRAAAARCNRTLKSPFRAR